MTRGVKVGNVYLEVKKLLDSIKEEADKERLRTEHEIKFGIKTLPITGRQVRQYGEYEAFKEYIDNVHTSNYKWDKKTGRRIEKKIEIPDVFRKDLLYEFSEWEGIETFCLRFNITSTSYRPLEILFKMLNGGLKGKDEYCKRWAVKGFSDSFRYKERKYLLPKQNFYVYSHHLEIFRPATKWKKTISDIKKINSPYLRFEFTEDMRNRNRLKKHYILNKIKN